MSLRPYQETSRDSAWSIAQRRPAAVVLATGLGKSHVMEGNARLAWEQRKRKPVLALAHTRPLIAQLAAKFHKMGWTVCCEQAQERALLSWARTAGLSGPTVVVASVQTMVSLARKYERWHPHDDEHRGRRYTSFPRDFFAAALIDETHHATAQSYRLQMGWFDCPWIGYTATPQRKGLADLFELAPGSMTIREGILDGWLVNPRFLPTEVPEWDLSELKRGKGDIDQGQLAQIVEAALPAVLEPLRESIGDRRCVAFWPSVVAATKAAEWLRVNDLRAKAVWADTCEQERREIFDGLSEGDVQIVTNCGVLTEGFDEPTVSCIGMMRPTMSESLYIQMYGRGVRPWPGCLDGLDDAEPARRMEAIAASPKPDCLILDYEGHGSKFKLASRAVLLSADLPELVRKRAAELLGEGVRFDEAEHQAKREAAEREKFERELAERAARAVELRKKSPWSMTEADYLEMGLPARFAKRSTADESARLSPRQQSYIYALTIKADGKDAAKRVWRISETWSKRAASDEIAYLQHRLSNRAPA